MQQRIVRILIPFFVLVLLGALLKSVTSDNEKQLLRNLNKESVVVHFPKMYAWIGYADIFTFTLFLVLTSRSTNGSAVTWVYITFAFFILLGIIIVFSVYSWKVEVFRQQDYFIYKPIIGKCQTILYADCKYFRLNSRKLVFGTHQRAFSIDCNATNIEFLLAMFREKRVKEIT